MNELVPGRPFAPGALGTPTAAPLNQGTGLAPSARPFAPGAIGGPILVGPPTDGPDAPLSRPFGVTPDTRPFNPLALPQREEVEALRGFFDDNVTRGYLGNNNIIQSARAQALLQDVADLTEGNPQLRAFLADPLNATYYLRDRDFVRQVDRIQGLLRAAMHAEDISRGDFERVVDSVVTGIEEQAASLQLLAGESGEVHRENPLGFPMSSYEDWRAVVQDARDRRVLGAAPELWMNAGRDLVQAYLPDELQAEYESLETLEERDQFIATHWDTMAEARERAAALDQEERRADVERIQTAMDILQDPVGDWSYGGRLLFEGAVAGGMMAPAIAAGAVAGPVSGAAALSAGLSTTFFQVLGSTYAQARVREGRSHEAALQYGLLSGLVEAATSLVPFSLILRGRVGVVSRQVEEYLTRGPIRRLFAAAGAEGMQEMVAEAFDIGYRIGVFEDDTITLESGLQQLFEAGLIGGGLGATFRAIPETVQATRDLTRAARGLETSTQAQNRLTEVHRRAQELQEQAQAPPETMRGLLDAMGSGEQVYIDADVLTELHQSGVLRDAHLADLEIEEALREASTNNGSVPISVGRLLALDNETFDAVAPDIRTTFEASSQREAQAEVARRQATINRLIEEHRQRQGQEGDPERRSSLISERVTSQLTAAGRSQAEARRLAQLTEQYYATRAERFYGGQVTAEQLFLEDALEIRTGRPRTSTTAQLDQTRQAQAAKSLLALAADQPQLRWATRSEDAAGLDHGRLPGGTHPGDHVLATVSVEDFQRALQDGDQSIHLDEGYTQRKVARAVEHFEADGIMTPPVAVLDAASAAPRMHVVDGRHRVEAARRLGATQVPLLVPVSEADQLRQALPSLTVPDVPPATELEQTRVADPPVAGGLRPVQYISVADLEGAEIIPTFGDRTRAGDETYRMDGLPVAPTPWMGGPKFPYLEDFAAVGAVWAADKTQPLTGLVNHARVARERSLAQGGDGRVAVTVLASARTGHMSNTSLVHSIIAGVEAAVEHGHLDPDGLQALDAAFTARMKTSEGAKYLKGFPGLGNRAALDKWLSESSTFESRKYLAISVMGSVEVQSIPGMYPVARQMIEALDPDHINAQTGDSLLAFDMDLDRPNAELVVDTQAEGYTGPAHPSYRYLLRGRVLGTFRGPVPMSVLYGDVLPVLRARAQPGSGDRFLLGRVPQEISQTVTREIVERAEVFEELADYRNAQAYTAGLAGDWRHSWVDKNKGGIAPVEFVRARANSEAATSLSPYSRADIEKGRKEQSLQIFQLGDATVQEGGLDVWFGLKRGMDYSDEDMGLPGPVTDKLIEDGVLTRDEVALVGVINNEIGVKVGGFTVLKAIEEGATVLDAFAVRTERKPDGLLPSFYRQFGFETVAEVPFAPVYYSASELADLEAIWEGQGWKKGPKGDEGYPPVVIMKWTGKEEDRADYTRRYIEGHLGGPDGVADQTPEVVAAGRQGVSEGAGTPDQERGRRGGGRDDPGRADPGRVRAGRGNLAQRSAAHLRSLLRADQRTLDALRLPRERMERLRQMYGAALHDAGPPPSVNLARSIDAGLVPTDEQVLGVLGDFPGYLMEVARQISRMREKLLTGALSQRDVLKAYMITYASQRAGAIRAQTFIDGTGHVPEPTFVERGRVRPEEAAAMWFGTPEGQRALDEADRGNFDPALWDGLLRWRDVWGVNPLRLALKPETRTKRDKRLTLGRVESVAEITDRLNEIGPRLRTGDADPAEAIDTVQLLAGVKDAKGPFMMALLGMGSYPTMDAVALNYWLTGHRDSRTTPPEARRTVKAAESDDARVVAIRDAVMERYAALIDSGRVQLPDTVAPDMAMHIMHHWLWDAVKGIETTHAGIYKALELFQDAYHGSPNVFDGPFSLQYMGTGEGQQVFGWGLYFGQNRDMVEAFYRDRLARYRGRSLDITLNGKPAAEFVEDILRTMGVPEAPSPDGPVAWYGLRPGRSRAALVEYLVGDLQDAAADGPGAIARGALKRAIQDRATKATGRRAHWEATEEERTVARALYALADAVGEAEVNVPRAGRTFKVNLPENDVLLQWDRRLSDQPPKVKEALRALGYKPERAADLGPLREHLTAASEDIVGQAFLAFVDRWEAELLDLASPDAGGTGTVTLADVVEFLQHRMEDEDGILDIDDELGSTLEFILLEAEAESPNPARVIADRFYQGAMPTSAQGGVGPQTGEQVYRALSAKLGGDKAASEALRDRGIAGHRFLDGDSRHLDPDDAQATFNFVIWDDALISILDFWQKEGNQRDDGPLGSYRREQDSYGNISNIITLLERANASTFLHETGHMWLFQMHQMLADPRITDAGRADLERMLSTTREWFEANHKQAWRETKKILSDLQSREDPDAVTQWRRDQLAEAVAHAEANGGEAYMVQVARQFATGAVPYGSILETAFHEHWARGFEAYLLEGKAPSTGLRAAFNTFASWLTRIYAQVRNLNVPISDEIRGVFDRLLATEQEIEEVRQRMAHQLPDDVMEVLTLEEREQVAKATLEAEAEARNELVARVAEKERRRLRARNRQRMREIREEVTSQVRQEPLYRALSILRRGTLPDGRVALPGADKPVRLFLSREEAVTLVGKDRSRQIPRGVLRSASADAPMIDTSVLARASGFDSATQLLEALAEPHQTEAQRVADLTEVRAARELPDLNSVEIEEDAAEAVTNSKQVALMALQARLLMRKTKALFERAEQRRVEREGAPPAAQDRDAIDENERMSGQAQAAEDAVPEQLRRTQLEARRRANIPQRRAQAGAREQLAAARRGLDLAAIKAAAAQIVQRRTYGETTPGRYRQLAERSANRAMQAIASRDYDAAVTHLEHRALNLEIARQAEVVRTKLGRQMSRIKRALVMSDRRAARTRDTDFVYALRDPARRLGLMPRSVDAQHETDALARIRERGEDGEAALRQLTDIRTSISDLIRPYAGISTRATLVDMPVEELSHALNQLTAGLQFAAISKSVLIEGQRVLHEKAAEEVEAATSDLRQKQASRKPLGRGTEAERNHRAWFGGIMASLTRMETWVKWFDAGRFDGPMRKYVLGPVRRALSEYHDNREAPLRQLLEILKPHAQELNRPRQVTAPELGTEGGRPFVFQNVGEIVAALLHTGNQSNLRKLLLGGQRDLTTKEQYVWGTESKDQETGDIVLDTGRWDRFIARMAAEGIITKQHMDTVQAIWDVFEGTKGAAQAAHRRMYGYYFDEVQADKIQTPWGTYRGGYAPAIGDHMMTQRVRTQEQIDSLTSQATGASMFPRAEDGFTKSRTRVTNPLNLDLTLVPTHLDRVMKFSYLAPTVREAAQLVNSRAMSEVIGSVEPYAVSRIILPFLERVVRQQVSMASDVREEDSFVRRLSSNMGIHIMGGYIGNALEQFSGVVAAMSVVKPRHILRALVSSRHGPGRVPFRAFIAQKSPYMRSRMSNSVQDITLRIDEILRRKNILQTAQDFAMRYGYILQQLAQNSIDTTVWMAAYNEAMAGSVARRARLAHAANPARADEAAERAAVEYADSVINQTQAPMDPAGVSAFEASTPLRRLLLKFHSYFNAMMNLNRTEARVAIRETGWSTATFGRLFMLYLTALVAPAVASRAIFAGLGEIGDLVREMTGQDLEDEEEDDAGLLLHAADWLVFTPAEFATGFVPFVGSFARAPVNEFRQMVGLETPPFSTTVRASGGLSILETTYQDFRGIARDIATVADPDSSLARDNPRALWQSGKDLLNVLGVTLGLPTNAVVRPLDVALGDED